MSLSKRIILYACRGTAAPPSAPRGEPRIDPGSRTGLDKVIHDDDVLALWVSLLELDDALVAVADLGADDLRGGVRGDKSVGGASGTYCLASFQASRVTISKPLCTAPSQPNIDTLRTSS